jgi:hypothetical protein
VKAVDRFYCEYGLYGFLPFVYAAMFKNFLFRTGCLPDTGHVSKARRHANQRDIGFC